MCVHYRLWITAWLDSDNTMDELLFLITWESYVNSWCCIPRVFIH